MMAKIVLCVLCLIVTVFAILSNNLVSNVYAQELQCPEINMLSIDYELSYSESDTLSCYYNNELDDDGNGDKDIGHAEIYLYWRTLFPYDETCWEFHELWSGTSNRIKVSSQ